jgi:hypothetical protein
MFSCTYFPKQATRVLSRRALLITYPEGTYVIPAICSLGIAAPPPGHKKAKDHTWSLANFAEMTLFAWSPSPLLHDNLLLARGPASHGLCRCHSVGPGLAHPGKVYRPPALCNNSRPEATDVQRTLKKNVFYVKKKVKTLYTVSAALCTKWQSRDSNIFKTFLKNNPHGSLILY